MSPPEDLIPEAEIDRLLHLLRIVDRSSVPAAGPHIVDDDDLLDRWSAGDLTRVEHSGLLQHVTLCAECSDILQEMLLAEALEFPAVAAVDVSGSQERQNLFPEAAQTDALVAELAPVGTDGFRPELTFRPRLRKWMGYAVTAVACCLIMIGYFLFRDSRADLGDVALAQTDLGQLTHYLTNSEFGTMVTGGRSKGGTGAIFVPPDEQRDQRIDIISQTVSNSPESLEARLNLAQALLEAGELARALSELEFVLQRKPNDSVARLGRAMVWYRMTRVAEAEAEFAALGTNSIVGIAARINQVICLLALDKKTEALRLWESVPQADRPQRLVPVLANQK